MSDMYITYICKQTSVALNAKCIGLFLNDALCWKTLIEFFMYKLSSA